MQLDIRTPIGLIFVIFGVLLAGYGILSDPAIYVRSLGINVNLIWGCVLFVFGAVMLWLSRRARSSGAGETVKKSAGDE